jgi:hypothetical protein
VVNREHRILTIDDGDDFCEELFLLLSESGFAVRSAPDTSHARALLGEQDFDLVILGTPSYYTDDMMTRATAAVEQLGIADLAATRLVILTYEPSFARDGRTLPGVTAISLYDFEISRFLESIQRAIVNA